jgi:hypothetical protein
MIRGFVYSFLGVAGFLLAALVWMTLNPVAEDTAYLLSGWLLLISFFAVGPLFFALGYWHSMKKNPDKPHWDKELNE